MSWRGVLGISISGFDTPQQMPLPLFAADGEQTTER
jgi:hypothetical protein